MKIKKKRNSSYCLIYSIELICIGNYDFWPIIGQKGRASGKSSMPFEKNLYF